MIEIQNHWPTPPNHQRETIQLLRRYLHWNEFDWLTGRSKVNKTEQNHWRNKQWLVFVVPSKHHTHTHTHTDICIYIYIYIYWLCTTFVVVRACVCVCVMDLSEMKWGYGATITQLGAVNYTHGYVVFTRQCTAIITAITTTDDYALACL